MTQQNLISVNLPENDLVEIKGAIDLLKEKLGPHLKSISPQDRHELPKMGDKTVAFVQKSLEYCAQNAELAPKYLDIEEFESDFESTMILRELHQPLQQLVDSLSDSQILLGSDAYQAALMFYNSVKGAAKSNISNAQTIYEDLANRFPTRPRKENIETE